MYFAKFCVVREGEFALLPVNVTVSTRSRRVSKVVWILRHTIASFSIKPQHGRPSGMLSTDVRKAYDSVQLRVFCPSSR